MHSIYSSILIVLIKKTEKSKGKVASTIKMLRQIVTTKIGKPPKHDDATQ